MEEPETVSEEITPLLVTAPSVTPEGVTPMVMAPAKVTSPVVSTGKTAEVTESVAVETEKTETPTETTPTEVASEDATPKVVKPVFKRRAFKPPKIMITEQVIHDMVSEALAHPHIETAWGICGFVLPDDEVFISKVIPPTEEDVTRGYAHAALGAQHQTDVARWLSDNARLMKKRGVNRKDARFAYLYKGHSHHRFGSFYSGTDNASILQWVKDDGASVGIGPLISFDDMRFTRPLSRKGSILVQQTRSVEIKFFYLSREMVDLGIHTPLVVDPEIVTGVKGLTTPPIGWHIEQEADFSREIALLKKHGCIVHVTTVELPDSPLLKIKITAVKPGWKGSLSIVTEHNYPVSKAVFTVNPFTEEGKTVEENFEQGETSRIRFWKDGMNFVDKVKKFEKNGYL